MTIEQLQKNILQLAKDKKWGETLDDINVAEKIALIHAELSETLEAYRKNNIEGKDGVAEELADAVIRILHLSGIFKFNLEQEILKKLKRNIGRSWENDRLHKTKQ